MVTDLTLSDLILYSIYRIEKQGNECTFERLVFETFTLFPRKFSFYTYNLPDSLKLDRQLRTLRKEKLVKGNNTFGFTLTNIGLKQASQIAKIIPDLKKIGSDKVSRNNSGRKEQKLIERLMISDLYRNLYKNKDKLRVQNVDEVKILFLGTPETSLKETLANISYFEKIAARAHKNEVIQFIVFCRNFLSSIKRK